jgi:gas vesicle protein
MQVVHEDKQHVADRSGGFVLGLLCGAAVGAALGLMFAPKPGVETRRQVAESADRLKRRASALYGEASDTVGDVMSRSREAWAAGRDAFQGARPGNGQADGQSNA